MNVLFAINRDWRQASLVVFLLLQGACLQGQDKPPIAVEALIRGALQPSAVEELSVNRESLPSFPSAVFYVGRRTPRTSASGFEDPRPGTATVVARGDSLQLVEGLQGLSAAWRLAPGRSLDSMAFVESVLSLLDMTRLVPRSTILNGEQNARARIDPMLLEDSTALSRVVAPSISRTSNGWVLTLFCYQPEGIFIHIFVLAGERNLLIESHRITDYVTRM